MTLLEKEDSLSWEKNNRMSLKKLKVDCKRPPVLHLPDRKRRFKLSDTSKFATGIALYQIQNGQPKLIAYVSKECQRQPRIILSQNHAHHEKQS